MIRCLHVGRYPEERLLHQSPNARRDAFRGGADGQARNQCRRHRSFYETEPFDCIRMDAPSPTIGPGDLAIHQGSGSQTETQTFPLFQTHPYAASPRCPVRLLVGLVDGATRQKPDPQIVRHYASPQAYAKISAQTGAGAKSSRASRPGARPQGGARVEKESSPEDYPLLRAGPRNPSLRGRESVCSHSPYRQNLDVSEPETRCPRFGSERRSRGSHLRGEPEGTFVFSVLQRQLQLQDLRSIHEGASRPLSEAEDFFYRRRGASPPIQDGQRVCPRKYALVVAAPIARLFPGTQSKRRGLERNQDPTAQCQAFERPPTTQEGGPWLSALSSKTTSQ